MGQGIGTDLRESARSLVRAPGYAAPVVLTLALGIGATAAVFAVVEAVLLRPLPFREPERLVALWEKNPDRGWNGAQAAPANLFDWGERATSFAATAGFADWLDQQIVTAPGEPTPANTMQVAGDLFGVLGATPALGRAFTAAETWEGGEPVAVLSHAFWMRRFGGDPGIVGRTLELDRASVRVVGVMPADFALWSDETDLWRPFGWSPEARSQTWFRRAHFVRGVARLAPGATAESARQELATIASALEREYPATNTRMGAGLTPLGDWLVAGVRPSLGLLAGAVALVLLVACANVAHLQLARAATSERERAVRGCLGASGWRLARRALLESLLLAGAGAGLGFAFARLVAPALARHGGEELARLADVRVGGVVVAFAAALAAFSALVAGALPAWQARSTRLEQALRESGRGGESRRRGRARRLLVAVEMAFGAILVSAALVGARSGRALDGIAPGYDPEGVLTARLALPPLAYSTSNAVIAFEDRLLARVAAIPGVESVGIVSALPSSNDSWSSDFSVEGRASEKFGIEIVHREASPRYFSTMRVPILRGRGFSASDDARAPSVVVVNETFARRFFADEDPIGLRICFDRVPEPDSTWRTIVGVVGDERQAHLARPPRPEVFAPIAQDPNTIPRLVVRSALSVGGLAASLRLAVLELDPQLPLLEARPMAEVLVASRARERFLSTLFAAFAGIATLLAAIGVYGVTAHASAGRRREIGVRLALGAEPFGLARRMLRDGALPILAGLGVGALGASALGRLLASELYGIAPGDPRNWAIAPALLFAVALAATWLPVRRAVRVAPAEVLRAE